MKTIRNTLLIVAAAGVGLAVGFALRGKARPATAESPAAASASSTGAPGKPAGDPNRRAAAAAIDDSPLATQLERDLSMSSGVTRWLYWLHAAEKAGPADFPRLLALAKDNPTAVRIIATRWAQQHPRQFFDTIVARSKDGQERRFEYELTSVLFEEWPKLDPEAAIAALNGAKDCGMRTTWGHQLAGRIVELDPERGLRLFAEWHIGNSAPRMTGVAKWAAADPRHAAEFTLQNPAGTASRVAMETIGKEWAGTDPRGALEFAAGKPGNLGTTLANTVLKEWAGKNLNDATAWLAGTDARTRSRLSPPFVESWAKQDSAAALAWCEANLTGSSLSQAVGGVSKGAADKDVVGAAKLVAAMEPSTARAEAAAAVAAKWFPDLSRSEPTKPETVAWLAGLDDDSLQRVMDKVTWTWSTLDPKSLAAFLASRNSDPIPSHAYSIVARELARRNPVEAVELTGRFPEDRRLAAGGDAFAEWRQAQPDTAMKWLNDLPAGDPRREAFFQSAIRVLAWGPQAAEQFAAMTPKERATARGVLEAMSIPDERRARLLNVLKGP